MNRRLYQKRRTALAEELRDLLARKNVSQQALAKRLNRSEAWVSQILSGKANPTIRTLWLIADAADAELVVRFGRTKVQKAQLHGALFDVGLRLVAALAKPETPKHNPPLPPTMFYGGTFPKRTP